MTNLLGACMYVNDKAVVDRVTFFSLFIWFLAAFFFLYEFFLRTVLTNLVHELLFSLKITVEQLSLIDIAYCITYGVMQIPVGVLVDRYGVKLALSFAVAICVAGVFLFSFAHGFYLAFFSRLLIGIGSAFAFICLLLITLNYLPKKYHATFFGFAQLLGAVGPLIAGAPTVLMLHHLHDNWRFLLLIVGLIGLILIFLISLFMKNKPAARLCVQCQTIPCIIKEAVGLLRQPRIWWIVLYSATIYVSLALLGTLWGSTYLETRGIPTVHAAFITSMIWFGLACGCPILGLMSDLFKKRRMILIFCALFGIGVVIAIIGLPIKHPLVLLLLFFSLGFVGAGQSVAFVTMAESVGKNLKGTALGLNNAGISFAIAMVIPTVGFLIEHSMHASTGVAVFSVSDFRLGLTIMPILYTVSLLVAIFGIKS
ncbi:MAG: MFS transporter [Gammaproteobacteria bacterium]